MIAEQLSIFDILAEPFATPRVKPEKAISMFDNGEHELHNVEPWMTRLLPNGEYFILLDSVYMLVLCATQKKVPKDLLFCHYKIGDKVYYATGVGIDKDADEEPEDEDSCDYE